MEEGQWGGGFFATNECPDLDGKVLLDSDESSTALWVSVLEVKKSQKSYRIGVESLGRTGQGMGTLGTA